MATETYGLLELPLGYSVYAADNGVPNCEHTSSQVATEQGTPQSFLNSSHLLGTLQEEGAKTGIHDLLQTVRSQYFGRWDGGAWSRTSP